MKPNNRPNSKVYLVVLLAISLAMFCYPSGKALAQATQDTHTVAEGETLFSIARQYDINVGDIRRWNNLDSNEVGIGQTLRITSPDTQDAIHHTVEPGETLFSLSRQYGVTIAEIQQWNNLEDRVLETGLELVIYGEDTMDSGPGEEQPLPDQELSSEEHISIVGTSARSNTRYTVKSGDTLTEIAREHDMTLQELRSLNNLESDNLGVGQQLIVRQSQSTPGVNEENAASTAQGSFVRHRIQNGENTNSILERYEMTEIELQALNPGTDIQSLRTGQQITVLMPPTRTFKNPYRKRAGLQDLGQVPVHTYPENAASSTTTSGELYNPSELTAAHPNMALGNVVYVENPANGKGVYVKINDRFSGNGIKLSQQVYELLDFSSIEQALVAVYLDE